MPLACLLGADKLRLVPIRGDLHFGNFTLCFSSFNRGHRDATAAVVQDRPANFLFYIKSYINHVILDASGHSETIRRTASIGPRAASSNPFEPRLNPATPLFPA